MSQDICAKKARQFRVEKSEIRVKKSEIRVEKSEIKVICREKASRATIRRELSKIAF